MINQNVDQMGAGAGAGMGAGMGAGAESEMGAGQDMEPKEFSKPASGGLTVELPLSVLASEGLEPEVGDTVQHSFEAEVLSVDEGKAKLSVKAIDGNAVPKEANQPEDKEPTLEELEQSLGKF